MESSFISGIHVSDVWFTGVVTNNGIMFDSGRGEFGSYNITLVADEVLAGYPECLPEGGLMRVFWPLPSSDSMENPLADLQPGERVFIKSYFDLLFTLGMSFGAGSDYSAASLFLVIKPIDDNVWYIPLAQDERLDMDAPGLAELKSEFGILCSNQSTIWLHSTKDMSSMPDTQQASHKLFLEDGRWVTYDDHINKRAVCVVHSRFAELRGLTLGDTLPVTMRDLGEYANYYAYGYIPTKEFWESIPDGEKLAGWQDFPTVEISLEIVGIYNDYTQLEAYSYMSPYSLTAYIPDSVVPEGFCVSSELANTLYSFKLKTSGDQDLFINENKDALLDIGISLIFTDNNAAAFWPSATSILQSALFNIIIFSLTAVVGLSLAVLLYLLMSRKVYAILRALGTSSRQADLGLFFPVMFISVIGILAGGLPAWNYAQNKAVETLSEIEQFGGAETIDPISGIWLALLCLGLITLVLLIIRIGTISVAKRPVLGLLQGVHARRGRHGFTGITEEHDSTEPHIAAEQTQSRGNQPFMPMHDQTQTASDNKRPAAAFHARFVLRHIWRSPVILPKSWVEQLGVELGDTIYFGYIENNMNVYYPRCVFAIAGQIDDDIYYIQEAFIPMAVLESLLEFFKADMTYSYAHFVIDPMKNRELPEFKEQIDELLNAYGAGYLPMRAVFWDEDLRTAISSLEQNIRLMTLLFPVTAVVSIILACGLSALLMHITARETAYLRVLGATKRRVRIVLCSQQIILYLIGLIVGFYCLTAVGGSWEQAMRGSILICAVLYICGAALASAIMAAVVTRRPPMQLLQVRE